MDEDLSMNLADGLRLEDFDPQRQAVFFRKPRSVNPKSHWSALPSSQSSSARREISVRECVAGESQMRVFKACTTLYNGGSSGYRCRPGHTSPPITHGS